jgi:hypothetical protein
MVKELVYLLTAGLLALGCTSSSSQLDESPRLTRTDTVSCFGITWRFAEKAPVGRFVTGDYYVVGPVTVVSITPKPEPGRNGSVLNLPPDQGRSPFDDRTQGNRYDGNMRAEPPIHMRPGDALISSISVEKVGELPAPLRASDKAISPVRTVSVLTCLDKPAPGDAFRPSYCRRPPVNGAAAETPPIYLARNLRWDLLPNLPRMASTPDIVEWAERYQRPWLDVCFFGFDAPIEYMPHYGRELGRAAGISTLLLMLDFPKEQKETLMLGVVQRGIDLWGILEAGYPGWQAHGGHGTGRKWPIVFAGIMLGDKDMASPYRKYPNAKFGEDMQTIYGKGWTGDTALYAGHVGADGEKMNEGWGAYEHLQPRDWKGDMIGENYRRCCTSIAWVGEALAARLLHAEKLWDHDAFFDYVDRWMTEDDTEAIRIIKEQTGHDYSMDWERQRQCWDGFVEEMWAKYRPTCGSAGKGG